MITGSGTRRAISSIIDAQVTTTSGIAALVPLMANGHAGAGVKDFARKIGSGNGPPHSLTHIALNPSMPDIGRGHEADRYARDQLVARVVRLLLAPGEEFPDYHGMFGPCRGRGHA